MNISSMYVPNVGKWMKYYQDAARGKENAYMNNTEKNIKQWGGGLSTNSNEFMIPIDKNSGEGEKSLPARDIDVKLVSPSQQIVEQAKSELKRKRTTSRHHSTPKRRRVHTPRVKNYLKHKKQTKRETNLKRKPNKKVSKKGKTINRKTPKQGKTNKKRRDSRRNTNKNLISQWLQ